LYKKYKVWQIRRKKKINVAILVSEIGKWKTEELFLAMQAHKRFCPRIVVVPSQYKDESIYEVTNYLKSKNLPYDLLSNNKTITNTFKADIIFYQEPYNGYYSRYHSYIYNLKALFCYVNYAFHSLVEKKANNQPLHRILWQNYFENESAAEDLRKSNNTNCDSIVVTGLPMTDKFLKYDSRCDNPWKNSVSGRKKIIWAAHHTLPGGDNLFINYSTFLQYYDFMLKMADKYKDDIVIAFKPHPVLKRKLRKIWGEDKVELYFKEWESRENTQLVEGDYVPLFMNSDAMIHDCSSFQIEYHYTHRPALYLTGDPIRHMKGMNRFAEAAFKLHYIGKCHEDIEKFILNVINGKDPMKEKRDIFYKEYLMPPNNRSSSQNILNAIIRKS